jgi:hypothetical protein
VSRFVLDWRLQGKRADLPGMAFRPGLQALQLGWMLAA